MRLESESTRCPGGGERATRTRHERCFVHHLFILSGADRDLIQRGADIAAHRTTIQPGSIGGHDRQQSAVLPS